MQPARLCNCSYALFIPHVHAYVVYTSHPCSLPDSVTVLMRCLYLTSMLMLFIPHIHARLCNCSYALFIPHIHAYVVYTSHPCSLPDSVTVLMRCLYLTSMLMLFIPHIHAACPTAYVVYTSHLALFILPDSVTVLMRCLYLTSMLMLFIPHIHAACPTL